MSIQLGLQGALPDSLRIALIDKGYELQPAAPQHEVVLTADRSDPNDLHPNAVKIALCATSDASAAAYRAGADFAVPPDASALVAVVARARTVAANRRAADSLRGSTLATLEREAILSAMKAAAGSTARAAAMLDISVRKVQYKLHEYGVPLTRRGAVPILHKKAANE
ncbi:MAG TPA: helix-turn-helix domain-containing protein [Polyangiaceae bacterium]